MSFVSRCARVCVRHAWKERDRRGIRSVLHARGFLSLQTTIKGMRDGMMTLLLLLLQMHDDDDGDAKSCWVSRNMGNDGSPNAVNASCLWAGKYVARM